MGKIINSKTSIFFTIAFSLILLIGLTIYKVNTEHMKRNFAVVEKRIIEGAQACVWNDDCTEGTITLGNLISLGYAKEEVNPKTKMYYSHNSYVEVKDNVYTFYEVK